MKKRKARVVYGVEDCNWEGAIRGLYFFHYEAENNKECHNCKIIRFIEADRKGGEMRNKPKAKHRQTGGIIDGKIWCEICKRLERLRKC